jgi:hypothetical protein
MRPEFFNLKNFGGDAEFKIPAGVVNTRIKNFAKNFGVRSRSSNHHTLFGCRFERSETSLAVTYCAGRPDNQRLKAWPRPESFRGCVAASLRSE